MRHILLLAAALAVTACGSTRKAAGSEAAAPAKTFVDAWDVTIANTPMGTVTGVLTLTEGEDQTLGGTFAGEGETFQLKDVSVDDTSLRATFYYPSGGTDVPIRLEGDPSADELTGRTMGEYTTTARRQGFMTQAVD